MLVNYKGDEERDTVSKETVLAAKEGLMLEDV